MAPEQQQNALPAKSAFRYRLTSRSVLLQLIMALGVALFFYFILTNTLHNLEQRGIKTGFGFLSTESGFGIVQTLVEYDETHTFGRTFLVGLLNTLLVSALGIIFASIIGFIIGVARLSGNWLVAKLAAIYIETFRNIPLLLQILFWYFAVLQPLPMPRRSLRIGEYIFLNNRGLYLPSPVFGKGFWLVMVAVAVSVVAVIFLKRWAHYRQEQTGEKFMAIYAAIAIPLLLPLFVFLTSGSPLSWDLPDLKGFNFRGGITVIPELAALLTALSIYTAAFIAEIVRSGIMSVSRGQTEAAYALGLRPGITMRLVVVPQAMRVIIPQLTSQFLNLTKNSSLATAVGYPDLVAVFAGTTLNQTGQAVEVIAMTMAVYLLLSLLISILMNRYNKKIQLVET